ncbi:MAG: LacI family transcriptional regulator [Eubacteriaceae bacterium]|nr:LacI family transcriptional regulator [Eubacteriaceae bacterium]
MVVKINDVAKEAMVSIATVSRVVNNIPIVNEETRLRVEAAIRKLNYKPNAIARSLKLQKTHTIAVITYDIAKLSSTSAVRGIEDYGSDNNYNVIIFNTFNEPGKELKAADLAYQKQCDGVIVLGMDLSSEFIKALSDLSIPVIVVSHHSDKFPFVSISELDASYEAACLLIESGHKDIAILESIDAEQSLKCDGFTKALEAAGIQPTQDWIVKVPITYEGGFEAMSRLLEEDNTPTAVLCANDDMACGAIRAAEQHNLRVPDDISVIGFYDFPISKWNNPAITTIGFNSYELGRAGMKMLIDLMGDPQAVSESMTLPHTLIERNSVKRI